MKISRRACLKAMSAMSAAALAPAVGFFAGIPAAHAAVPGERILVVYYSRQGHTAKAAQAVAAATGGRLLEIETDPPYPKDYSGTVAAKKKDDEAKRLPKLAASAMPGDLSAYDVVFIGSPIWSGDLALAVKSWLGEAKLAKKKIALFVTHMGSGVSDSQKSLEALAPGNDFAAPLSLYSTPDDLEAQVRAWTAKVLG